jgi:hypothetical protein
LREDREQNGWRAFTRQPFEWPNWLFGFFGSDAESDASVQRDGFKLDVEAVAVGVRPHAADASPKSFVTFAVADNRIFLSRG